MMHGEANIKFVKETKKQHYNTLMAKSNNKMKATWNIIKKQTGKVRSVETFPNLLMNDGNLNDPKMWLMPSIISL